MKGIELVEKYGKAGTVIKDFYNKKFMKSLDDAMLPDNFREIYGAYNIDNETVGVMIDKNPSQLFEIFDAHGIYIQINVFTGGAFSYSIIGDVATVGSTDTFPIRIEAEKKVIEIALEILNDKL
jgi:hypothetical protein